MTGSPPWPLELKFNKNSNLLNIHFDNGDVFNLSAEYLRVESPSAEVQGHGQASKVLVTGKKAVSISRMEPVGNYAVRLIFDDGHDTGLFSWDYLFQLGREHAKRWHDYLARLEASGLKRAG